MSALIWVQNVCEGYRQMTKIAADKESLTELQNMLQLCILGNFACLVVFSKKKLFPETLPGFHQPVKQF